MELGRDPDRREEAEGNLTANWRPTRWLTALALGAGLLSGGSAPAATPAKCTLARIAEWPVRPGRGSPVVDGSINGKQVGIILDTGASDSIILRSAADRLGLVRRDVRGGGMIGVGGESSLSMVSIDELAIGTAAVRNWRVLVAGERAFGSDVAMLLGQDFFQKADIEFDLAHDAIRLYQARDCENKSLAYWATDGAGVVELDTILGANPTIELTVEIDGRPVKAQLDSGAYQSVLTKSRAASLGITPAAAGVVAGGCSGGLGEKAVEYWTATFQSFRIGDELIRNPTLRFSDIWKFSTYKDASLIPKRPAGLPDMLLGADFLRSHRVLIAHSQRKMYFTYAGGTVFPNLPEKPCDDASPRDNGAKAAPGAN